MTDIAQTPTAQTARKPRNWLRNYTRIVVTGFACWLIVRSFVFQGASIPSNSMEGTLHQGDYIYVNKLPYGPRIPITILTIPFTDRWLDWIQLPYYRLPGTDSVKINDVIVFNLPTDTTVPVDCRRLDIKRCVALPGDSFSIHRGTPHVNGIPITDPENALFMYSVVLKPDVQADSVFRWAKFSTTDSVHYVVRMTSAQAIALGNSGDVISIVSSVLDADRYDYTMFPQSTSKPYRWNSDNFGPVLVPKKNLTISLSLNNIHLYKDVIAIHEGNTLENRNDSIYINGQFAPKYTFKMDYYFVLGDNRYDSNDSRYWGFVPEDHLVGRVNW